MRGSWQNIGIWWPGMRADLIWLPGSQHNGPNGFWVSQVSFLTCNVPEIFNPRINLTPELASIMSSLSELYFGLFPHRPEQEVYVFLCPGQVLMLRPQQFHLKNQCSTLFRGHQEPNCPQRSPPLQNSNNKSNSKVKSKSNVNKLLKTCKKHHFSLFGLEKVG